MTEENHIEFAKKSLVYLINRIKNYEGDDKFVTYGKMAKEIGYPEPYTGSFFGKRIGHTLGIMGHLFDNMIVPDWKGRIPFIQSMVVNQNEKLPSDGLKEFYPPYPKLSKKKKLDYLSKEYNRIFDFGERWYVVLDNLNAKDYQKPDIDENERTNGKFNSFGSEGSPEHRNLRDYISENPELVNFQNMTKSYTEFPLKSGDSIDALFESSNQILGVEVKSIRSGKDDLQRGIFQCIKYREVLKAESIIDKVDKSIDCILVYEGVLTNKLRLVAEKLDVKTIQKRIN